MSGIFLAYSRADRALAARIVQRLRGLGVEVWWDEDMPGVDWQDELARKALELAGVLVVWTPNSTASRHVKDEARLARENDKLINVVIGVPQPPFPYDAVNALPLDGWTGREPHNGWSRTVQTVEDLLVRLGAAKPGEITGALARLDAETRDKQAAVAAAQEALQAAQTAEAEASDSAGEADRGLVRAQAQYRSVLDQGLGRLVVEGARQELDAAREAKVTADQALRQAKSQLSGTARAVAHATADLEALIGAREEADMARTARAAPPAKPEPRPAGAPVAEAQHPADLALTPVLEAAASPATADPIRTSSSLDARQPNAAAPATTPLAPETAAPTASLPPAASAPAPPLQGRKNPGVLVLGALAVVLVVGLVVSIVSTNARMHASAGAQSSLIDSSESSSAAESSAAATDSSASSNSQDSLAVSEANAAMAADKSGDYQSALNHWAAVIMTFPRGSVHAGLPLMSMALDYHHLGQDQTALEPANDAVADFTATKDQNLAFALEIRGAIEERLGQNSNAIADYSATLANNPDNDVRDIAAERLKVLGAAP